MTLDDFFTLTEMNNGLAAPARVRELVAVMQKESNCVVKNISEATRQWHAVASAIAATENQECLDLFIQLDGLQFIVKWLKDAQKFGNDSNDEFIEESITHMLRALGKLHVDYDKLINSEMWTTVKDLLAHSSSKVQDKARVLFESWEGKKDGGASLSNVEDLKDSEMGRGSEHSEPSQGDGSLSGETPCKEKGQESTKKDDPVVSASSDAVHPGQVENGNHLDKGINPAVGSDSPSEHVGSPSLVKPTERLTSHSMGATSVQSGDSDVSRQDTLGVVSASDTKLDPTTENSPGKLESAEDSKTTEARSSPSGSGAADATKSVTEPSSLKNSVSGHTGIVNQDSTSIESKTIDSNGKGSVENNLSASQCGSSSATELGDELKGHKLSESSSGKRSWESTKGFGAFLSGLADQAKINNLDQDTSDVNLANDYKFAKRVKKSETSRTGKKSDSDLLGLVDPLEMALQVAIEVGREVGDYKEEQSGSVSEKQADGNVQMPDSPDSVSGRHSHTSKSSSKDVSSCPESSDEASPLQEESATNSKNKDAEQTNEIQNTATSQVTEVTQEGDNTEKDWCNFDLNEEVYLEEVDHPRNELDTPISIVSASRAAATAVPELPIAPLQFEGYRGWRGIAATSAFRPASPRRMPENEKDCGLKLRQGGLDIDLNVAESFDGRTEDQVPVSGVPFFSALPPPGEGSVGTNPKSVQLELDLNNTSEHSARPYMRQFFPHGNGYDTPSSSKLPSLKNIDLNDQPSFLVHSSGNSYASQSNLSSSVISIMGTRVEVNCKDNSTPQTVPLSNGRTPDLAFDVNAGRTANFLGMLPYAHSHTPVYSYNNVPPGPPIMPFSSSPIYGSGIPVPYMIGPRGTPIIPQIVGASTSATPMGFSQTPFYMNMAPTPSNVGAAGSSRSTFDLNSGTVLEGGGSREPPGFTQFLNLGPVRPTDDQTRYNSQTPFGSAVGGKRKEPDNMWEHYPAKRFSPQWK